VLKVVLHLERENLIVIFVLSKNGLKAKGSWKQELFYYWVFVLGGREFYKLGLKLLG